MKKTLKHICEVCGKVEILTSKQAFDAGYDYPGEGAIYPTSIFGVLSPRTCGYLKFRGFVLSVHREY